MYYRPVKPDGKSLDDQLKFVLRDQLGSSNIRDHHFVGTNFIDFLKGYIAGTPHDKARIDAQKLIDCLEKYQQIEIWEEH